MSSLAAFGSPPSSTKRLNERAVLSVRLPRVSLEPCTSRGRCVLCGARADHGVRLHVDQIVPWPRNGRTVAESLQTLCDRCNLGKGNRSTRDFRGRSRSQR
jgi:5-methylcytosine-specific restriction endonuclease McrA